MSPAFKDLFTNSALAPPTSRFWW